MAFDNAGNIVNDAAVLCGLTSVADPYSSSDQAFIQLRTFLKYLGRDLCTEFPWTELTKEATITTVTNQSAYALPDDFARLIDSTGWNRTSMFPWAGPVTPQEWQLLVARSSGTTYRSVLRRKQGQIHLYPPTTGVVGGDTIAYEYLSSWWTCAAGGTAPTTDAPATLTDICWFDPALLVAGIRLRFLQAKGFDSTAAQMHYDDTLEAAKNDDVMPRVVNMAPPQATPTLGDPNVPLTGFGIP